LRAARLFVAWSLLLSLLAPAAAFAKTVICIDARDERFCTCAEGYYRSKYPVPPNEIHVTKNLHDCLSHVADGDVVIVVAHGQNEANNWGGVFNFGDSTWAGFGPGGGSKVPVGSPPAPGFPLTPTFLSRRNLIIKLVMCWSGFDPDQEGPRKSSVKSLEGAFPGGSGVTVTGFEGTAGFPVDPVITGGSADQRTKAKDELRRRTDWLDNPPPNRPGATTTQKTKAQEIVDGMFPTKGMTVTGITYLDPVAGPPPHQGPYLATFAENECGDAFVPEDTSGPVPALGPLTLVALLALAWLGAATLSRRTSPGTRG
jgi:hypothetical protein